MHTHGGIGGAHDQDPAHARLVQILCCVALQSDTMLWWLLPALKSGCRNSVCAEILYQTTTLLQALYSAVLIESTKP